MAEEKEQKPKRKTTLIKHRKPESTKTDDKSEKKITSESESMGTREGHEGLIRLSPGMFFLVVVVCVIPCLSEQSSLTPC